MRIIALKRFKKTICEGNWNCRKKAKVFIFHDKDNEILISSYCIKCFREKFPTYLEKCSTCEDNFDCYLQKTLYSKKELKKLKRELKELPNIS
jgi:hypothetical protein